MEITPTQIAAVVFDLDGLMVNTEELYDIVGETLLSRRGHRFTTELKDAMTGRPGRVALQIMIDRHGLDATVEDLQAETDEIFPDLLRERLAPMPGLLELLTLLDEMAMRRAIATSSRRHFLDQVLSRLELDEEFEFMLTSESVHEGKPAPEIYQTAAATFGVSANQMLVLEDSENGCRAAVAAGAQTVAVPGDHSRHHDFTGVALIADSLADRRIRDLLSPRG